VPKRQIVLTGKVEGGESPPLGSLREVLETLSRFNTAPDGGARNGAPTAILHGPGMVIELPTAVEEIRQALVTLLDEDMAWPVLTRLCQTLSWRMMDPESGRSFG
jgi:hypothetical protein